MNAPAPLATPSAAPALDAAQLAELQPLLQRHQHQPGGLLPLLHAVQDALGHIPPAAVPLIAQAMNLSRAEVHGVITYYHHFRSAPAGKHVVQVCQAEACKACGGDALMAQAELALGCASHHTREDGAVTLEPVYCLGLCASSPAIQIDDKLHARVSADKLQRLLKQTLEATP